MKLGNSKNSPLAQTANFTNFFILLRRSSIKIYVVSINRSMAADCPCFFLFFSFVVTFLVESQHLFLGIFQPTKSCLRILYSALRSGLREIQSPQKTLEEKEQYYLFLLLYPAWKSFVFLWVYTNFAQFRPCRHFFDFLLLSRKYID